MIMGEKDGSMAMMAGVKEAITLKMDSFTEKIEKSRGAQLVFFCASSCTPCKLMETELKELEKDYSGRVTFFRVNTDEDIDVATKMAVVSTPTLILFVNGKPVMRQLGYVTRTDLVRDMEEHLGDI